MTHHPPHLIDSDEDGIRLDRWFKRHFPSLTHGELQKLLRTGQVRLDGKRAEASDRVATGQSVRVPPQLEDNSTGGTHPKSQRDARDLKKLILFEDADVLVLNKPAGLAVQGGTGLRESVDSMLDALADSKHGKPKLVHRLDRDTSGVLLIARTPLAATRLAEAFRARDTQKIYWGVTLGVAKPEKGQIETLLVKRGEIMVLATPADTDSKKAVSLYHVVEKVKDRAAFVELSPVTGRTHQLRVHMAHLGTPLLGDRLYGKPLPDSFPAEDIGKGLHLHASRLVIPHPRKGVIDVTAPLSAALKKTWTYFGFGL